MGEDAFVESRTVQLSGDSVVLRPASKDDVPTLARIRATPEVRRRWRGDDDLVAEKVGFRPVGIMRQYERSADGTWHDGLLMDLLADDYVAGS